MLNQCMDKYMLEDVVATVEIDHINDDGEAVVEDDDIFGEYQVNLGQVHWRAGDEVKIRVTINQMGNVVGQCIDESEVFASFDSGKTNHHTFELPKSPVREFSNAIDKTSLTQRKL